MDSTNYKWITPQPISMTIGIFSAEATKAYSTFAHTHSFWFSASIITTNILNKQGGQAKMFHLCNPLVPWPSLHSRPCRHHADYYVFKKTSVGAHTVTRATSAQTASEAISSLIITNRTQWKFPTKTLPFPQRNWGTFESHSAVILADILLSLLAPCVQLQTQWKGTVFC